jgi:hypothetical protein
VCQVTLVLEYGSWMHLYIYDVHRLVKQSELQRGGGHDPLWGVHLVVIVVKLSTWGVSTAHRASMDVQDGQPMCHLKCLCPHQGSSQGLVCRVACLSRTETFQMSQGMWMSVERGFAVGADALGRPVG